MLVFPTRLFAPREVLPSLTGGALIGGRSLGGASQYGEMSGGGLWQIEQRGITMRDRAKFMSLRALGAAARNGATPMIVPIEDRKHQPVAGALTTTPFDDLTLWDDAVAWDQAEVDAVVAANAALRAATLTLTLTSPRALIGGEFFSILHGSNKGWRLYCVERVISGGLGTGDSTVIQFSPPLRAAVAEDTPLNFDSPRCVCRVVGGLAALYSRLERTGTADAVFEECFPESLD